MAVGMGKAMAWSAVGRFGKMGIMFIANIVLARILSPSEFGTMGILLVFIGLSEVFIDGGLASALIQNSNPTKSQYSGVFFFNLSISIILYLIIFISSPYISDIFNDYALIDTLRVIGVVLIINSIGLVQLTMLNINLSFKKISIYELISSAFGTVIAVILAFLGFGIWSLVFRNLISSIIVNTLLWINSRWFPTRDFSFKELIPLFKFGWYVFLSSIFEFIYAHIQPVLIGKYIAIKELGYYSQARKLEEIPTNSISGIMTSVFFPILSKIKDDKILIVEKSKKALKNLSFIVIPLMMWLIAYSQEIIIILLGEKWADAIPLLRILSIAGIFRIPSALNMCIIKSLGKSKSFLSTQFAKRTIGIVFILIGLKWGMMGLMWGFVIGSLFFFVFDSSVVGHYIGYGTLKQTLIMFPYAILASVATISSLIIVNYFNLSLVINLILGTILTIVSYGVICSIFKLEGFTDFYRRIKNYVR